MMESEYDVIIVGAGPAGSMAAKAVAEGNHSVLVLDKKQEIGTPKRCAEGINARVLASLDIKPDPRWAVNNIRGAVCYSPSGNSVKTDLGAMGGYVLERKIFEKHLATQAIKKGARYMVKTNARGVLKENGVVKGVKADYMGEEIELKSKIVIAADGVDSKIARDVGIDTKNVLEDYHSGFQYEMAGLKLEEDDKLHIYFGEKIAPKGYVWIFPKGDSVANVGIGILGKLSSEGNRAIDYLNRFIESHPEIFQNASPIEINAGGVPMGSPIKDMVDNGFMVVGDAAHHVNPIHGGGISLAMEAGIIAGQVASEALDKGDVSQKSLNEYQRRWEDEFDTKLKKLMKLRYFLEKITDKEFEIFAKTLSGDDIMKLTESKYTFLIKILAKNAPHMAPLAKKFLSK